MVSGLETVRALISIPEALVQAALVAIVGIASNLR
jgi:hypothetical protein